MCGDGDHRGYIADISFTRRSFIQTLTAAAAASGAALPAQAADPGARKVRSRDVVVRTADGNADAALFVPVGSGKWPAVLLWPDILGLRPVFREMGERLAAQGYVVLVPNPYYRARKAPVLDGPIDFGNPADRKKLGEFSNALSDETTDRDSHAFVDFLDSQRQTDRKRKAGVQGYCMSGPMAFRTAAARPGRIGAAAAFHPRTLVTDKPESPHLLIPTTNAAFLVMLGKDDAKNRPTEEARLKEAFAAAKRPAKVEVSTANHGWTVAGNGSYDETEAERAWKELLALYRANLR